MNTNKNIRLLAGVLALTGAAIIFFRCTGDGPPPDTKGNHLFIRLDAAATNLNPLTTAVGASIYVAAQIFQTLGILDPQSLELKPLLIKSVPKSRPVTEGPYQGCLAYDFEINEAAVWDNGSPVTAQDVLFTTKLIFHPLLPTGAYRGYFEYLKDIQPDPADPRKFTVYFSQYYILAVETLCQIPIYPAYNYDPGNNLGNIPLADLIDTKKAAALASSNASLKTFAEQFAQPRFATDPAGISGSGPYKLESLAPDQGLTLVKKTGWWGDKVTASNPMLAAYPEKITYKFIKDEAPVENQLKAGELDVVAGISPAKFIELRDNPELAAKYDFSSKWPSVYTRWIFNLRNPKVGDKRVRQALAHAVDYDYLVNNVGKGMSERLVGMVPRDRSFYAKNITPYDYNIQKAKDLLTAAGWTDTNGNGIADKVINGKSTELSIEVYITMSKVSEMMGASILESARKAGIELKIMPLDLNRLSPDTREGRFESAMLAAAISPGLVDFYQNFHSKSLTPQSADNRSGFVNPLADSLITAIRTTEDEATRTALYVRMQELIYEELPEIYITAPQQRFIISKRFNPVLSANRPGYFEQYFTLKK